MSIVGPHIAVGHVELYTHGVAVSVDELAERACYLKRRVDRTLVLDEVGIDQAFNLVGIVHACTCGNDAPHPVPVERC